MAIRDEPTSFTKPSSTTFAEAEDPNNPFYRTPESRWQARALKLTRALRGGSQAMRDHGEDFLPKFKKETQPGYERRLNASFLLAMYDDTLRLHRGEAFPEPIHVNDSLSPKFDPWLKNVDLEGRSLDQWAPRCFEAGEDDGIVFVLVDKTRLPAGATLEDQDFAGARPYFVLIKADDVLGWRHIREGADIRITQFRYLFRTQVNSGLFGSRMEERVRVIEALGDGFGTTRVFGRDEEGKPVQIGEEARFDFDRVPIVPFYTNEAGFLLGEPYLGKLAEKNLEHWQSASDQRNILKTARVPFHFFAGFTPEEMALVSDLGSGLKVANSKPDAKVTVVEHGGEAIEAGRQDLQDLERQMEALAKAPLMIHPPGQITATKTAIDSARGSCAIREMLIDFESSLNQMIRLMGEWNDVTVPKEDPINLFKDVGIEDDVEWQAELVKDLWSEGKIALETAIDLFQRLDVWPDDLSAEEVREALEAEKDLEPEPPPLPPMIAPGQFQTGEPMDGEDEDEDDAPS